MKHSTFAKAGMATAALSFIMMIALVGCEMDKDTLLGLEPPEFVAVTAITGVPVQAEVGTKLTLSGTVAPSNATNTIIVWGKNDTGTTATATVTDNKLEATTAGIVIVTATITNGKTETTDYTEDFEITVYTAATLPTVTTVTVSPATPTVAPGETQTFTATVTGNNSPSQSVEWTIVETNKKAGTTISATGELTVASDETLATLTVKATSNVNRTKSGTATITVTGDTAPAPSDGSGGGDEGVSAPPPSDGGGGVDGGVSAPPPSDGSGGIDGGISAPPPSDGSGGVDGGISAPSPRGGDE